MKRRLTTVLIVFILSIVLGACKQKPAEELIATEVAQPEVEIEEESAPAEETAQTSSGEINTVVIPCPMDLPAGEVEGETAVCGQITVPENWDKPGERTINITYAILKAKSLSYFPDAVIYLEGGPGGTALEDIEGLSTHFSKIRATRDFIYYDQRGTDYSGNLECPFKVQFNDLSTGESATDDSSATPATPTAVPTPAGTPTPAPPIYEQDPDEYLARNRSQDVLSETNCRDYFAEQGVDLTQYTTEASIRDLTALMNALEYDVYNVYGISYGSRLGLELMRAYEKDDNDIPEIRSVVIDGIDPPHVDSVTRNPFINMYIVLDALSDCEVDAACGKAYPDIRQRAIDLLTQTEEKPLEITSSDGSVETIQGKKIVSLLSGHASVDEDGKNTPISSPIVIPYIPRLIDELSRGVGDVYLGLLSGALPPAAPVGQVLERNQMDPLVFQTGQLAEEANLLSNNIEALAIKMWRAANAMAAAKPLPEYYVGELVHFVTEQPSFQGLGPLADLVFFVISSNEANRENLTELPSVFGIDGANKASLDALVAMMSDEEVFEAYNMVLSDRVKEQLAEALQQQTNTTVLCNDLYTGFDIDTSFEAYKNAEAPQLLSQIDTSVTYIARCERYGLTEGKGESTEPVVSSLKTLVVNGSVDKNTAARWGQSTFEYLPNAQIVTVPLIAHGASALSACGQDITSAFITYPEQTVNDSCIAAMQPVYVLPDDDLGIKTDAEK